MSVPALRFNEFSSCWIKKKLGEVSTYTKGFAFKSDDYQENGTRIVRVSDLTASAIKQDNQMIFIDSLKAAKYSSYKLNNGDIVITTVGSKPELLESAVGRGILITKNDEGLLNQNLLKLNSSEKMNNSFLFRQINSERYIAHIKNIQRGNANQSNITLKDLFEFDVFIAESKEQTKVANFLTAVDEKITQLTQKRDLLTQYKKGVMQQIFSHSKVRSDCTVSYPRGISRQLRFKDDDGQDFPEWEDTVFGDAFEFVQTNSHSREMLTYESGEVKNIHYGDIHKKFKSNFRLEQESVPYLSATVDVSKIKLESYCKSGDIVVADASEDYADVGKAIEIIEIGDYKLVAGLHTYIARDRNNKMALGFGGYLMQSEYVRTQIKVLATGVSVLSISKGNLGKVKVQLPNKPEQTKIANFLTTIDDKITATQTQLQAVKQYKQGLLQQMFV